MPIRGVRFTSLISLPYLWIAALAFGQSPALVQSPIDARIQTAEANIKASPKSPGPYNELALALCRKGRDSADVAPFEQAQAAIAKSLQLSKGNYEARKLQVTVFLGLHDFGSALQLATELNRQIPDDPVGWAALVDANIALGNYGEAERQAQWVLDLRPGNALGFEKAAALREVFGDVPGAVEFLDEANQRTLPGDKDQRAWLLTQKARLQLVSGYDFQAETVIMQALQLFPDSQSAAVVMAHVRQAQGRWRESVALLETHYHKTKSVDALYDWADALENSGEKTEAVKLFRQFEAQAIAESGKPFNANLRLIFYLLNRKHDGPAALRIAQKMRDERHTVATLDAYAWALFGSEKYSEAKIQIESALAIGVRDPLYFCHAAQIAAKLGNQTAAAGYEHEAASFKGFSCSPSEGQALIRNVTGPEASR